MSTRAGLWITISILSRSPETETWFGFASSWTNFVKEDELIVLFQNFSPVAFFGFDFDAAAGVGF